MLGMCNYVHYVCAYNREGFLANLNVSYNLTFYNIYQEQQMFVFGEYILI